MLLSPPFVLPPLANESADQHLERVMTVGAPGSGSFPVSFEMNWHGGVHLAAPAIGKGRAPVRAIADATVAFVRKPTARSSDPKHPLNYRSGWTDDGCVVLKHQTAIGADPQSGAPTTVVFFSVYMHLASVSKLSAGDLVYRKDVLGAAGSIYGVAHQLHLEVVCDDANVKALTGRQSPYSAVTADGRADAIFGSIWFFCPFGTSFYQAAPQAGKPLPPVAFTNSDEAFFFKMTFDGGDATFATFHVDGNPIGQPVVAANYGYGLVANATARYPKSPSAGVELLRFGRVVGPDPLSPANAPNWAEVPLPAGTGWIDLNAAGIHRFSDADFPSWDGNFRHGWVLVDAASSPDSRCKDPEIIRLLDLNQDSKLTPQEAQQQLNDPAVQGALRHKICKFPTEWDASTIDARFGWMKTELQPKPRPAEYQAFHDHAAALCFWQGAQPGIDGVHWHFHPREFIRHFQKCLWLSDNELAQCIPRKQQLLNHTAFSLITVAKWATAHQRAAQWAIGLNLSLRKYLVAETALRIAHYLAQVFAESGFLHFVSEIGGASAPYAPYYGRGLIQLTHPGGYKTYGDYRGFPATNPSPNPKWSQVGWDPDALIAASNTAFDAGNCVDTASFFWSTHSTPNGQERSDAGPTQAAAFGLSQYINGFFPPQVVNGLDARLETFIFLKYVLLDDVATGPTESLTFVWRRNSQQEPVFLPNGAPDINPKTGNQRMKFFPTTWTIDVPLDPQRP